MNDFVLGKISEDNSKILEWNLVLEIEELDNNDNIECLFVNYLWKMRKLTKLIIDFRENNIDYEDVDGIVNLMSYFGELVEVEWNLGDNYIDNVVFE